MWLFDLLMIERGESFFCDKTHIIISKVVGDFGGQKLFGEPETLENVFERSRE